MQCLAPITINQQGEYLTVSCRRCLVCLQNRRNEWALRLGVEFKHARSGWVFSLTYDNEHIPLLKNKFTYMVLDKKALQKFTKNLKQFNTRTLLKMKRRYKWDSKRYALEKQAWTIKYYGVGEYGTLFKRPHYHIVIFNMHPQTMQKLNHLSLWPNGGIYIDKLSQEAIAYTAKYLIDDGNTEWEHDPRPRPFSLMSKGLGKRYIDSNKKLHKQLKRPYCILAGVKYRMPRYYKDRIFSTIERRIIGKLNHEVQDELVNKKINKLSEKFGSRIEAIERYEESIQHQVKNIRVKALKSNKF